MYAVHVICSRKDFSVHVRCEMSSGALLLQPVPWEIKWPTFVAPALAVVAERPRTETTEPVTLEPIENLLERASPASMNLSKSKAFVYEKW